jgi:hypothetical protein
LELLNNGATNDFIFVYDRRRRRDESAKGRHRASRLSLRCKYTKGKVIPKRTRQRLKFLKFPTKNIKDHKGVPVSWWREEEYGRADLDHHSRIRRAELIWLGLFDEEMFLRLRVHPLHPASLSRFGEGVQLVEKYDARRSETRI